MGVRKMMVVVSILARRRSGTDAERKRISSVIGPYLDVLLGIPKRSEWRTYSNVVSVPNPSTKCRIKAPQAYPVSPSAFRNSGSK